MKKSPFGLIIVFVLFASYYPKNDFIKNLNLNIKEIEIKNNLIIKTDKVKRKLDFLYDENLFLLNTDKIQEIINKEEFLKVFL